MTSKFNNKKEISIMKKIIIIIVAVVIALGALVGGFFGIEKVLTGKNPQQLFCKHSWTIYMDSIANEGEFLTCEDCGWKMSEEEFTELDEETQNEIGEQVFNNFNWGAVWITAMGNLFSDEDVYDNIVSDALSGLYE